MSGRDRRPTSTPEGGSKGGKAQKISSFFTPKGELTSDTNKRKPKAMEVDIESNKRPKVDVLGSPVLSTLFGTGGSVSHVARPCPKVIRQGLRCAEEEVRDPSTEGSTDSYHTQIIDE
jgi:hypothetical protein